LGLDFDSGTALALAISTLGIVVTYLIAIRSRQIQPQKLEFELSWAKSKGRVFTLGKSKVSNCAIFYSFPGFTPTRFDLPIWIRNIGLVAAANVKVVVTYPVINAIDNNELRETGRPNASRSPEGSERPPSSRLLDIRDLSSDSQFCNVTYNVGTLARGETLLICDPIKVVPRNKFYPRDDLLIYRVLKEVELHEKVNYVIRVSATVFFGHEKHLTKWVDVVLIDSPNQEDAGQILSHYVSCYWLRSSDLRGRLFPFRIKWWVRRRVGYLMAAESVNPAKNVRVKKWSDKILSVDGIDYNDSEIEAFALNMPPYDTLKLPIHSSIGQALNSAGVWYFFDEVDEKDGAQPGTH
jgi:hypothetical protein